MDEDIFTVNIENFYYKTGDLWFESRLAHKFFSQKLSSIFTVANMTSSYKIYAKYPQLVSDTGPGRALR